MLHDQELHARLATSRRCFFFAESPRRPRQQGATCASSSLGSSCMLQLPDGRWSPAAIATADVARSTGLLQSRHAQQLPPVYHAATTTSGAAIAPVRSAETDTGGVTPSLRCTEPPSGSTECVTHVVGCEYHRGSRWPSLANKTRALFGQCGCSRSFPAVGTYSSQLAEWARYNPSPINKKRLTAAGDAPAKASAGAGQGYEP